MNKEYKNSVTYRANCLYQNVLKRATKNNLEVTIDLDWIKNKLENGFCEVTKLSLVLEHPSNKYTTIKKNNSYNPFTPSIDRKDSTKGYTKDNSQVVIWIYNNAKNMFTEEALRIFCKAYLANTTQSKQI